METVSLRGASYLWQPWFAQVNGGFALTSSQSYSGASNGSSATSESPSGSSSQSKAKAITGSGALQLLPRSYFPFSASVDVSDSRTSSELVRSEYTSRRLALVQRFSPPEHNGSYTLTYDRSVIDSDSIGSDTASSRSASMTRILGEHAFNATGTQYENTRSATGDRSSISHVAATHSFRPQGGFSVDNLLNFGANDYRLVTNNVPGDTSNRYAQANSMATWRPGESSPWLFVGGARLFQANARSDATDAASRTLGANAAATYTPNRNTTFNVGGTVTQASSGSVNTLTTNQMAGVNYNADTRALGQYQYGWNTGGNLSHVTGGGTTGGGFSLRAGHNLRRSIALGPGAMIGFNVAQSLSRMNDSSAGATQVLGHTAGLTWSIRPTDTTSGFAGLTGYDSRATGHTSQHFQMINLQVSGQAQLGRFSTGGANITVRGSRQTSSGALASTLNFGQLTRATPSDDFVFSSSGSLNYQNARFFNVPRLRYSAFYTVNQMPSQTRFDGDINAPIERISQSLEQRLDYNIGKIETRLSLRVAQIQGRTDALLMFRITRPFGAY